jgi:hypothetical protein
MTVALTLFALAAVGGLLMAIMRLRGRPVPPLALALVHGLAAAAGLVVLIAVVAAGNAASTAVAGLVLMLLAAVGGFLLFANHLRKKELPIGLMIVHALVAVTGFLLLLVGALT